MASTAIDPTTRADEKPRTLSWAAFGVANLLVVTVLGLVSWYLVADPQWGLFDIYPQPLTAWMFWAIIAFVWLGFTLELHPIAGLSPPLRGLAALAITAGLGAFITWVLAFGWGAVDASFAAAREGGVGYLLGSLIVLYSFVCYTMSAVNWGHWPWSGRGLKQPWLGIAEMAGLAVPVLVLYAVFAVPPLATWATAGSALLDPFTQIGYFYSVVVASILTAVLLENWPWRLAGTPARTALAATLGNLALGYVLYVGQLGVAALVLGQANVTALGETFPLFAAQVGVCWVFWLIMWSNAFGNWPTRAGTGVAYAARIAITFALAVVTFALYYYVIAGTVLHEPAAAEGATVYGSPLIGMDWLILWALWYVVAAGSWGLPALRTEENA